MASDYIHIETEFVENKSNGPNGPWHQNRFVLEAGAECRKMERAFHNMAPSAGGYHRHYKCGHCGHVFDETLGSSIFYHLRIEHGVHNAVAG